MENQWLSITDLYNLDFKVPFKLNISSDINWTETLTQYYSSKSQHEINNFLDSFDVDIWVLEEPRWQIGETDVTPHNLAIMSPIYVKLSLMSLHGKSFYLTDGIKDFYANKFEFWPVYPYKSMLRFNITGWALSMNQQMSLPKEENL